MRRYENGIVYLEDPRRYDYVRETVSPSRSRSGKLPKKAFQRNFRLIAYATLHDATPGTGDRYRGFGRRYWYVMPGDRCYGDRVADAYREGIATPSEAVDPLMLAPGEKPIRTCRALCGSTRFNPGHECRFRPTGKGPEPDKWKPILYAERPHGFESNLLVGICPGCGRKHTHGTGGPSLPVGEGDGPRSAHCGHDKRLFDSYDVREVRSWPWLTAAVEELRRREGKRYRMPLHLIEHFCRVSPKGARIIRSVADRGPSF